MQLRLTQFNILCFLILFSGFSLKAQENYTLQKALQLAKENSPYLKSAQLNISIEKTNIITAKLRPNLSLHNESLQLMRASQFAESTNWYTGENREMFWELSKPFQLAGQRKHKIEVANKGVSIAEKDYEETERNLFLNVANKWLELWTIEKQLEIIQTAKGNIDSLSNINKIRYQNEVITKTELYRTELLAKQYAIQHKTALQEVKNHRKELAFLLGVEKEVQIDTADHFLFAIPKKIEDLIDQSIENRSDIRVANSLIEATNSDIKLQKSMAFPEAELGVIWNPQNTIPYLGISFTIDLPFFNRNQGEIKKAYHRKEQAEQELLTIEQQIGTEIAVAFSNYQLQQQNVEDFKELLTQSQNILDNVKHSYLKGGTTIIDFLEAQRSWLETQQQHYDALESFKQSYIQMLYTTGLINQLAL